ncbi:hypothetical protein HY637_03725 [Candidatus Woesearchaeota archaeon]|nr:hypothetical protein [Candidatus Woesearchaeota archaeon]
MTKKRKIISFWGPELIIICIILSVISGLQHIIMAKENGALYDPLPVKNTSMYIVEGLAYASNVNSVINGNYFPLNAHLEGKENISNNVDIFPSIVLGLFGIIFGIGIKGLAILTNLILPPIVFLLYFYFCHKILGMQRLYSIFVALFLIFFVHDIALLEIAKNLLTANLNYFKTFYSARAMFVVSRFMQPGFTIISMISSLIFLVLSFKKKGFVYPVLTGLIAAVLAYSYFYYFAFFWATFACFAFFMALFARRKEHMLKLAVIAVIGIALSLPYVLRVIEYGSLPHKGELLARIGASFGRNINMSSILFAVFLLPAVFLTLRKDKINLFFISSSIIAGTVLLNIQLLIGYTVQYWHWWFRIINPLYVIISAFLLQETFYRLRKLSIIAYIKQVHLKIAGIFGVMLLLLFGAFIQIHIASSNYQKHKFTENEISLYKWLKDNAQPESTVLTISIEYNYKLQAYTRNNVYLPNALLHNLNSEEVIDRLLSAYSIFSVSNETLWKKITLSPNTNELEEFEDYDFINYLFHHQFNFNKDRNYLYPDDNAVEGFLFPEKFRQHIMNKWTKKDFKFYDFDYVLAEPYSKEIGNTDMIKKRYKKVYENGDFAVYSKND